MGMISRLKLALRYRNKELGGWRFDTVRKENITEREITKRHGETPLGASKRSYKTGSSPPYNRDDIEYHERYAWAKRREKELERKWRRERWRKRLSRIPFLGSYFASDSESEDT